MGFALPAAIGAKLALGKGRTAVAVEGDGSFLMNNVELSTAVQLDIPIIVVVLNNYGWVSIRDLQIRRFAERIIATEFRRRDGSPYVIDFEKLTRSFGAEYFRAETPEEYKEALSKALKMEVPTVVEAVVERRFPHSGTKAYGHWDIPSPYV